MIGTRSAMSNICDTVARRLELALSNCIEVELPRLRRGYADFARRREWINRRLLVKKLAEWSWRHAMRVAAGVFLSVASVTSVGAQTAEPAAGDFGGPRWVATWGVPPMAHGSAFGAGSR